MCAKTFLSSQCSDPLWTRHLQGLECEGPPHYGGMSYGYQYPAYEFYSCKIPDYVSMDVNLPIVMEVDGASSNPLSLSFGPPTGLYVYCSPGACSPGSTLHVEVM